MGGWVGGWVGGRFRIYDGNWQHVENHIEISE